VSRAPAIETGPMKRYDRALVWFRRDLRCDDHAALFHALKDARAVHCVFVFDTEILDALENRADRRVEFIWRSVQELGQRLREFGGGLHVLHGRARELVPRIAQDLGVQAVYANHDYEPGAIARDEEVAVRLRDAARDFHSFKDQVIFEKDEVLTGEDRPYTVFTPYKRAWLQKLEPFYAKAYPVDRYAGALASSAGTDLPSLEQLGFRETNLQALRLPAGMSGAQTLRRDFLARIDHYKERRDFPAIKGPSYLSVHLRFGTISIRSLVADAMERTSAGAQTWLSELIWRDFYFGILHHFPHVAERAFRPEYEGLQFGNDRDLFLAWCEARTGYPIVDAAMRQINQSGYMHNSLRMIVASFLVKDLHIDWRWGERYFAARLNDYDMAANNGGWQWSASTGCDAQPYFRIFNPVLQSRRFDAEGRFLRQYLPQLARVPDRYVHEPWTMPGRVQEESGCVIGEDYPAPIVDHDAARRKTLQIYGVARKG
jgi:deoxyribodipyrimidine photo-lyase